VFDFALRALALSRNRLLTRYGDEDVARVRPLRRAYATSLVKDEWPVMMKDQRRENTARAFATLSRRILAINPSNERQNLVLAEMFKTLDTMADVWAQRLNMVTIRLTWSAASWASSSSWLSRFAARPRSNPKRSPERSSASRHERSNRREMRPASGGRSQVAFAAYRGRCGA